MFVNKNNNGFSILEVVVAIGIISLFVVSIAKVLQTVDRLNVLSEKKDSAVNYAQESIEIVSEIKNDLFVCSCNSGDNCTSGLDPDICTRTTGDGKACDMFPAYSSCWSEYPDSLFGENNFYLDNTGGVWQLTALVGSSTETIVADPSYSRRINIVNAQRDTNGDLVDAGGTEDFNTKIVRVTVWYEYRGVSRSVDLKTVLTAWENI